MISSNAIVREIPINVNNHICLYHMSLRSYHHVYYNMTQDKKMNSQDNL